jgi:hypothetical protein
VDVTSLVAVLQCPHEHGAHREHHDRQTQGEQQTGDKSVMALLHREQPRQFFPNHAAIL